MDTAQATLPDLDRLDHEALKALVREQHAQLLSQEAEIEHLQLLLAKLQRQQFGRKSERVERQIEQLEQRLEDLETSRAERLTVEKPEAVASAPVPRRPARKPLPAHLPRETKVYAPPHEACPSCGGALRPLGEDVSEVLEYVPASFQVLRHVRPKFSCAGCERIVQAPGRAARSSAVWPVRACWRMCWWPNMPITSRCIGRAGSMRGAGWNWSARRWLTG